MTSAPLAPSCLPRLKNKLVASAPDVEELQVRLQTAEADAHRVSGRSSCCCATAHGYYGARRVLSKTSCCPLSSMCRLPMNGATDRQGARGRKASGCSR
eukprot:47349-Eustigmatos_ZCMA.PRE.1